MNRLSETPTSRRDFLRTTATVTWAGMGACRAAKSLADESKSNCGVRSRKEPVAIAMWDFSWLERHYRGGEFEDWDMVIDELVARGYNAIRFDVFPALVAPRADGKTVETHTLEKTDWKPVLWGNQYTTQINPRKALKEFIPRCVDRGLLLGLSTWFMGPGVEKVTGLDGLVRVWDQTLTFLKENDLLHNIYYVDLLNEYPLYNGFAWIRDQMNARKKKRVEEAKAAGAHQWKAKMNDYNDERSRAFYVGFINDAIERLQKSWPDLDFLFSQTTNNAADWRAMASSRIAAIDLHDWFVMDSRLTKDSGYWNNIHSMAANDLQFPRVQQILMKNWGSHKGVLVEKMDRHMAEVSAFGKKFDKPIGNTEGWGTINWMDHPALTWDLIKESGEICAGLARKHGYRFICTSNFTHPQFPRLWADVAWHRKVTSIIRNT